MFDFFCNYCFPVLAVGIVYVFFKTFNPTEMMAELEFNKDPWGGLLFIFIYNLGLLLDDLI